MNFKDKLFFKRGGYRVNSFIRSHDNQSVMSVKMTFCKFQ